MSDLARGITLADANRILAERRQANAQAIADAGLSRAYRWPGADVPSEAAPPLEVITHRQAAPQLARSAMRSLGSLLTGFYNRVVSSPWPTEPQAPPAAAPIPTGAAVSIFPCVAAAMLDRRATAGGRLWLLLRAVDDQGRGFWEIDAIHARFSSPDSDSQIASRRRVNQLLREGNGVFWYLRNGRNGRYTALQMCGIATVAARLGVTRLTGKPQRVLTRDLQAGIGKANAAIYAAALAARKTKDGTNNPITRSAIFKITGVPASTQRVYSRLAAIGTRRNFVLLPSGDEERKGTFLFTDSDGRISGKPGRVMLARQMANTYTPPLIAAPGGRKRKTNRKLASLVDMGRRGNGQSDEGLERVYHTTQAQAGTAWSRGYHVDRYYRRGKTRRSCGLWGVFEATA